MELTYEITLRGWVEVTSPYNAALPIRARKLGGSWSAGRKVWRFKYDRLEEVLALYESVYGMQPAKRYQGPSQELYDEARDAEAEFDRFNPPRKVVVTEHGDTVRTEPEPGEPPRMVRSIMGLKPGDRVNVTLKDGKLRELVAEKKEWALDKDVGIPYAELELRTLAHAVDGLFTPDGLLSEDVAKRTPSGGWKFPRHIILLAVNERLAALDKKVKMLMAERGPGIKPEPELVVPVDHGWDD